MYIHVISILDLKLFQEKVNETVTPQEQILSNKIQTIF